MGVLVACKNEEDPIKNEGARVVTTLFIDFSHAQGQLTLKSVVESCRNSNPSKLSWLTLLPARMKNRAGKFYSSTRHGEWKFLLMSKLFNLLVLKGEWKLLSKNKEFVVCAVETGKCHIHKGI